MWFVEGKVIKTKKSTHKWPLLPRHQWQLLTAAEGPTLDSAGCDWLRSMTLVTRSWIPVAPHEAIKVHQIINVFPKLRNFAPKSLISHEIRILEGEIVCLARLRKDRHLVATACCVSIQGRPRLNGMFACDALNV